MVAAKVTTEIRRRMAVSYIGGLTIRQIAKTEGLSFDTVRKALIKSGIGRRDANARWLYDAKVPKMVRLYSEFHSLREIAEILNIPSGGDTVRRYLRRAGVVLRDKGDAIRSHYETR
jgi:DNA-directed RNA polymerase specialized sigma24 family protein